MNNDKSYDVKVIANDGSYSIKLNAANILEAIETARKEFKKEFPDSYDDSFKIVYILEVDYFLENNGLTIEFVFKNRRRAFWDCDFTMVDNPSSDWLKNLPRADGSKC